MPKSLELFRKMQLNGTSAPIIRRRRSRKISPRHSLDNGGHTYTYNKYSYQFELEPQLHSSSTRDIETKLPAHHSVIRTNRNSSGSPIAILDNLFRLHTLFPDFPQNMMTALLVRENGNSFFVCQELVWKGWGPRHTLELFENKIDPHFSTPYFHGSLSDLEIQNLLQTSNEGTFLTFYRQPTNKLPEYFLCFKNSSFTTELPLLSPIIPIDILAELRLKEYVQPNANTLSFIPDPVF